ncbi:MAG: hypothetical protein COW01_16200 [Bdellovibrionales bacterium CG12_big_fil_rev_8_21_14_0_65_38_15]|nr:MAG: hypothetical protein COW79_15365 [Bdellovibrionales bacterium CG22_combo_CG10-13_8_21_14_all_38_13]PIQ52507.1 MAG: hypothetical protein COW01_16200 [Bdellovibrionales bacterium CG12_big_fil_rev_8_21_14_0_65_38_15]PIR29545.1 MAG: hypothetical protein COV38_10740 [Bdellovibrionales bacterium CG11_big_fil_rev_8_21_14_0_20_38_13]
MRLFKNMEPSVDRMEQSRKRSQNSPTKKSKHARAPKETVSASEIRNKVEEHFNPKPTKDSVEVSELSKVKNAKAMKVEVKEVDESTEKEIRPPSDVGLNDPNDPTTVGKLKDVLSKGAFSFNPKERETLEKILNDRS